MPLLSHIAPALLEKQPDYSAGREHEILSLTGVKLCALFPDNQSMELPGWPQSILQALWDAQLTMDILNYTWKQMETHPSPPAGASTSNQHTGSLPLH